MLRTAKWFVCFLWWYVFSSSSSHCKYSCTKRFTIFLWCCVLSQWTSAFFLSLDSSQRRRDFLAIRARLMFAYSYLSSAIKAIFLLVRNRDDDERLTHLPVATHLLIRVDATSSQLETTVEDLLSGLLCWWFLVRVRSIWFSMWKHWTLNRSLCQLSRAVPTWWQSQEVVPCRVSQEWPWLFWWIHR